MHPFTPIHGTLTESKSPEARPDDPQASKVWGPTLDMCFSECGPQISIAPPWSLLGRQMLGPRLRAAESGTLGVGLPSR